jgi:hypothetical protein
MGRPFDQVTPPVRGRSPEPAHAERARIERETARPGLWLLWLGWASGMAGRPARLRGRAACPMSRESRISQFDLVRAHAKAGADDQRQGVRVNPR